MRITVEKSARRLTLWRGDTPAHVCRAALGHEPTGAKRRSGDGRTPEGVYHICLVKPLGKYGRSLGLDYPNASDALAAFGDGLIDADTRDAILAAHDESRRPPWGTPMGGEIYLHEGGAQNDWTAGCIALESVDMDAVFPYADEIDEVEILP